MSLFHLFKSDVSGIELPEKFTFPFYYEPHSLAKLAAKELQIYLESQTDFTHNFGFDANETENPIGKMFGVLVVKNKTGQLGYLAAFSGKLEDESCPEPFVPPVFDLRTPNSFYRKGEQEIENINQQLTTLKNDPKYLHLKKIVKKKSKEIEEDLALQRRKMKRSQKKRKLRKNEAFQNLAAKDFAILTTKLAQESFNDQFFYKELLAYYTHQTDQIEKSFSHLRPKLLP